jgi:ATP-dependent DNA ligase
MRQSAFDLLRLDGKDLTSRPLVERKWLLDDLQLLVGPARCVSGCTQAMETPCSR